MTFRFRPLLEPLDEQDMVEDPLTLLVWLRDLPLDLSDRWLEEEEETLAVSADTNKSESSRSFSAAMIR